MTHTAHTSAASLLYEQFSSAVASESHDLALLLASQAVAEATTRMQCFLVNTQSHAVTYPGLAFLVHVVATPDSIGGAEGFLGADHQPGH
jgi:hypothetical protein